MNHRQRIEEITAQLKGAQGWVVIVNRGKDLWIDCFVTPEELAEAIETLQQQLYTLQQQEILQLHRRKEHGLGLN